MDPLQLLIQIIGPKASQPVYPAVQALADRLLAIYPDAAALLFYGSCMRSGQDRGGMVDLYVLVDSYRTAYPKAILRALNRLLPPNVFYLEVPYDQRRVRAKFAVLSLEDFERGTSKRWFHSYLWGRFAQPATIVYARRPEVTERIVKALAQAIITFIGRAVPCTKAPFSAHELWFKGLSLSYRAELRAERAEKLTRLVDAFPDYYEAVTRAAMPAVPFRVELTGAGPPAVYAAHIPSPIRWCCRQIWRIRFLQGKVLSVLRLLKAAFTFNGGAAYILWKIERHSGVKVDLTPHLQRHPLLAACVLSWRLYRRGAFR